MTLLALGLNYETAPLAIRERVAFTVPMIEQALLHLKQTGTAKEALILSTCNRTELYCKASSAQPVLEWWSKHHHIPLAELHPYVYLHPEEEAIRHAFRVASGLNSMVLGEPQILGQMRHAIYQAEQVGALGTVLHRLFQSTLTVAKQVRSTTEIGSASISMASAIVRLAGRLFPSLHDRSVLLVGAGEMMDLVATHLLTALPKRMVIANRTLERAQRLAAELTERSGASVPIQCIVLEDIPYTLPTSDIVVSCTGSTLPVIGKGVVERALKQRKHTPIFMVDLAVPRDIEPEVATLEDIFLYTVDDLAAVIRQGLHVRQSAVAEAERLIHDEVQRFLLWRQQRAMVPIIHALQHRAEQWRQQALKRARRHLTKGASPEEALEELSRLLTQKWMHSPLSRLHSEETAQWSAALVALYDLQEDGLQESVVPALDILNTLES
jgi:glutamyl-tRNA reductase